MENSNLTERNSNMLPKYTTAKSWFYSLALGLIIGLAVIIPGISGATVAIMFGLYGALVYSMGNILNDFKRCFIFLLPIIAGMIIGFLIGFFAIQNLYALHPFVFTCLFAGLMIGAMPIVISELSGTKFNFMRVFLLVLGIVLPVAIGVASLFITFSADSSLIEFSVGGMFIFFGIGVLVSITQLIPGLSATALLLACGIFGRLLSSMHFHVIANEPILLLMFLALGLGFLVGIVLFSKLINLLLKKKRQLFFCLIVGLSIGSIISMFISSEMMSAYKSFGSGDKSLILGLVLGLVLLVVGFTITFLIARYELRHKKSKEGEN
ncbi:MAG: DUF368 domain-containing protein [Clostridia bacterium]|nr:DUF368 domain-containing protein [Clostridia bacterium]